MKFFYIHLSGKEKKKCEPAAWKQRSTYKTVSLTTENQLRKRMQLTNQTQMPYLQQRNENYEHNIGIRTVNECREKEEKKSKL